MNMTTEAMNMTTTEQANKVRTFKADLNIRRVLQHLITENCIHRMEIGRNEDLSKWVENLSKTKSIQLLESKLSPSKCREIDLWNQEIGENEGWTEESYDYVEKDKEGI